MNKPNILFIMTDQHRWDALGCYGNEHIQTPNIDSIAESGVRFTHHFVQGPQCIASRACIFTGRYVAATRQYLGRDLPASELVLPEYLRQNGYRTLGFGKFHLVPEYKKGHLTPVGGADLDPQPKSFPWYGFDYVEVQEDTRAGLYTEYLEKHGYTRTDDLDSGDIGQWKAYTSAYPEEHYQTTRVTDRAVEHLNEHNTEQPLFMFVSYTDPHHPFHVPAPYDTMYDPNELPLPIRDEQEKDNNPIIKNFYHGKSQSPMSAHETTDYSQFTDADWLKIKAHYYGKISLIDKNIGRILDSLRSKGMLDNTLIVFTPDHGEHLGDHWLLCKGKSDYDQVIRTPLLLSWPGKLPAGRTIDSLAQEIDIFPTICDLLELPVPEVVQGLSQKPVIDDPEKELYEEILVETGNTIRSKEWRLTVRPGGYSELYDLKKDPNQFRNVFYEEEYAAERQRLMERLVQRLNQALPQPKQEAIW